MKKLLIGLIFLSFGCKKELETIIPIKETVKSISIIRKGDKSYDFDGYKVSPDARQLGKDYWLNVPVLTDTITSAIDKNIDGINPIWKGFTTSQIAGDFNNDGYIDVFNPGTGQYLGKPTDYYGFYIWNPKTKTFDTWDLLTNVSKPYFGQGQYKSIPTYLNDDNYVDIVLFDSYDEASGDKGIYEPIRVILSDGNGGYKLIDCPVGLGKYHHSGDIGDLDGDGIDDIVICTGPEVILGKGSKTSPYFTDWKTVDYRVAGLEVYYASIKNIIGDNKNDLILGSNGSALSKSRILENIGNDFKLDSSLLFPKNNQLYLDYKYDDLNNDGRVDIIGVSVASYDYRSWSIDVFIQDDKGRFNINNDYIYYKINVSRTSTTNTTDWKSRLIYQDFNGDGIKDITYIDSHNFLNKLEKKTVFIRKGKVFEEEYINQYDPFLGGTKRY